MRPAIWTVVLLFVAMALSACGDNLLLVDDAGSDSDGSMPPDDASLDASPERLVITTASLPAGSVGVAYSATLAATGGTQPYTWQVSTGSLPPGLGLAASGELTGTPTTAGNYTFTVTVSDAANPAMTANASFTIGIGVAPVPLVVLTTALPNGVVDVSYSAALSAGGGAQPYSWTITAGSLPPGIVLAANGTLSGTPTVAGTSLFTVQVTDSSAPAQTASAMLGITVLANSGSVQVTTVSLPGGTQGSAYAATLSASGGLTPYSWSVASGTLPPGLSLGAGGDLSGTPNTLGTFTFVVQVADSSSPQQTAQKQFSIRIDSAPLAITTTSLPNGVVGNPYTATVTATGGLTPYRFIVATGSLPTGITLNATTGALSGTPSVVGSFTFTIEVSDASTPAKTDRATFTVTISAASAVLVITTTSLPDAVTGVAYSATLTASGGTTPYTWSVGGGSLPAGLTLNSATGVISGTPTATGSVTFTIRVVDSASPQAMASAPFTINVRAPLRITTTSLPAGVVGTSYGATVAATGGATPYTFSVTSGSLPPGLTLAANGTISGTPSATGSYGFSIQVTDSANPAQSVSANLSITVTAALQITTTSLAGGTVGVGYSETVVAAGGTSPYTWSVSAGALPPGLGIGAGTGIISGTPSAAGTFSFTLRVQDTSSPQQTATKALSITITAPSTLTITTTSLPGAVQDEPYSAALSAVGGASPYTWSISAGALPPGLALSATTGVIEGMPTNTGTSSFTVRVVDSSTPQQAATRALTITVTAPLEVTTASLPDGATGASYSATLAAAGGTTPYTWSISTGALPPGLSLDAASGAITGTPTSAGSFGFTVRVVDASNPQQSASATLTITITAALAITTATLPNGTVGTPYSASVGASGGTTPYSWAVSSGVLPTGLTLNTSTGAITGTPSATGTFGFTITVTDSSTPAQTASASYTVVINGAGTLTITTTSFPNGVVGTAYSASAAATGGTTPYTWSVSAGALPAGLVLNTATGAITGTPTSAGSFAFTLRVTDASAPQQSATRSFTITIVGQLAITTTALPDAVVGVAYSTALGATGGTTPYTWSIASGSLPAGLSLNATTGVISGTPSAAGTSDFTVRVVDSSVPQQSAMASLSITVADPLAVTTTALPNGTVGVAYSATLAASGGTTPYTWSITNGSLPAGLSLDPATGAITGTPTTAGTSAFQVTATDSANPAQTASRNLSITVNSALNITTTSLPAGSVGVTYSATVQATGGTLPYSWSIASGSLPPGLTLNASTGRISGLPTTAGPYNFTVQVQDASNPQQTDTQALSILITDAGALTITTSSLPDAVNGTAYSATLAATGGTTPYAWSITGGALPPGLTLNASTGAITGTPTASGTFSFTVQVEDADGNTASRTLSIRVSDPLVITTMSLPGGVTGTAYSATLTGSGGVTPYAWSVSAGALPAGLTLDAATGTISGTPTASGTFNFTIRLVDASTPQQTTTRMLSITVTAPLAITTLVLPPGRVNVAYSATLAATGGTVPYVWSVSAGALPAGLTLNATTGVLSGTPTTAGNFTFTIAVTDASTPPQQDATQYSVRIFP